MAILEPITINAKSEVAVTLRSAKREDASELLDVSRTNISSSDHLLTQSDEFGFSAEQLETRVQSFADNPNDLWLIALVDRKIVGVLDFRSGARRRNSHQGDFGTSILPEYRGQGIGRAMLGELLRWARGHDALEQVRLKVHSRNTPAVHLYSSLGFIEEGRERRGVKISNGVYDDVICMVIDV